MSNYSDKISYAKGLADGLNLDAANPTNKLLLALLDAVDALGEEAKRVDEEQKEMNEYIESIDDDISELEDEIYGDDDDEFDEDLDDGDDRNVFDDDDDEDECDCCDDDDDEDDEDDDEDDEDDDDEDECDCCDEEDEDENNFGIVAIGKCPYCGAELPLSQDDIESPSPIVCPECKQELKVDPNDKDE